MLLGAADQRVPHSQGREWVAALQSQPSPPEVGALEYQGTYHQLDSLVVLLTTFTTKVVALEYPGEGHAIAGAEQQAPTHH